MRRRLMRSDVKKEWMTIFPDYPYAFAWIRSACDESTLDSYVGGCCGDAYPSECRADMDGIELSQKLAEKVCSWMAHWRIVSDRYIEQVSDGDDADIALEPERNAVDQEGLQVARMLKAEYGDRYRFRYSRAFHFYEKNWEVV